MKIKKASMLSIAPLALFATIASSAVAAGEVTVTSTDGGFSSDITVRGSSDADNITIRSDSAGQVRIIGNNGTTINFNGSTSSSINVGIVGDASIFMGSGNDRVRILDTSINSLNLRLGRGNDFARFRNHRGSGLIRGGQGRDVVRGGINSVDLRSIEVDGAFSSAIDRGEPTPVTTDTIDVVSGASASAQISVGERFVVPADFSGSASISGFDSHGERFLPQDVIDVSAIDADVTQPGNQAFTLVVGFRGNPGELIIPNEDNLGGGFLVAGDVDGDAVADFTINLVDFSPVVLQSIGPWFDNFIP